jgi:uncharacterized membrane protein
MNFDKKFIIFSVILLLIDVPWVLFYMAKQYKLFLGKLNLTLSSKAVFAVIAYCCMILSYFLIKDTDYTKQLMKAGLMGLIIYGTYAFTLLAFMPGYTFKLALTEVVWGIILYLIVTKLTEIVSKILIK